MKKDPSTALTKKAIKNPIVKSVQKRTINSGLNSSWSILRSWSISLLFAVALQRYTRLAMVMANMSKSIPRPICPFITAKMPAAAKIPIKAYNSVLNSHTNIFIICNVSSYREAASIFSSSSIGGSIAWRKLGL